MKRHYFCHICATKQNHESYYFPKFHKICTFYKSLPGCENDYGNDGTNDVDDIGMITTITTISWLSPALLSSTSLRPAKIEFHQTIHPILKPILEIITFSFAYFASTFIQRGLFINLRQTRLNIINCPHQNFSPWLNICRHNFFTVYISFVTLTLHNKSSLDIRSTFMIPREMPKQMCRSSLDYFTLTVKHAEVNIFLSLGI